MDVCKTKFKGGVKKNIFSKLFIWHSSEEIVGMKNFYKNGVEIKDTDNLYKKIYKNK